MLPEEIGNDVIVSDLAFAVLEMVDLVAAGILERRRNVFSNGGLVDVFPQDTRVL